MNKVESIKHTFLVQHITQYLKKFGVIAEVHIVRKPDIILKDKKGRTIALEIETGISFKKRKTKIKAKFEEVIKEYPNTHIVLTDSKYKRHYTSLTSGSIPILVRTDLPKFFSSVLSKK